MALSRTSGPHSPKQRSLVFWDPWPKALQLRFRPSIQGRSSLGSFFIHCYSFVICFHGFVIHPQPMCAAQAEQFIVRYVNANWQYAHIGNISSRKVVRIPLPVRVLGFWEVCFSVVSRLQGKVVLEVQQPHIHSITGRSAYNFSMWKLQCRPSVN